MHGCEQRFGQRGDACLGRSACLYASASRARKTDTSHGGSRGPVGSEALAYLAYLLFSLTLRGLATPRRIMPPANQGRKPLFRTEYHERLGLLMGDLYTRQTELIDNGSTLPG